MSWKYKCHPVLKNRKRRRHWDVENSKHVYAHCVWKFLKENLYGFIQCISKRRIKIIRCQIHINYGNRLSWNHNARGVRESEREIDAFVQLIRKISANHVSNLLPLYNYVFIWEGKETENLKLVIFSHGILIKVKEKFVWTLLNLRFDVFIWKILLYIFFKTYFLRFSWKRVLKKQILIKEQVR